MTVPDPKAVKKRQRFLRAKGFDPGPVDGIEGNWTRRTESIYADAQKNVLACRDCDTRTRVMHAAKKMIGKLPIHGTGALLLSYCGIMGLGFDKNPYPCSTQAPNLVIHPTWQQGIGGRMPRSADAFGIYYSGLHRVGHVGLVLDWAEREPYCLTIEPTAEDDPRERIVLKRRMKSDIYVVKDWIGDTL